MIDYMIGFVFGAIITFIISLIALKRMEKDGAIIYKKMNNRYSKVNTNNFKDGTI